MFNHQPSRYVCPFCLLIGGGIDGGGGVVGGGVVGAINTQRDIVRRNGLATAFVSPRWWPRNHGHVVVIPDAHHENLYDLPGEYGHAVHDAAREVAIAMRATYGCDGTSVRQHNEPAGNQDVWHYHVHVFPRYVDDGLYGSLPDSGYRTAAERLPYAEKLRAYFASAD